jgi:DNA-binding Xre family transcriptional regulator
MPPLSTKSQFCADNLRSIAYACLINQTDNLTNVLFGCINSMRQERMFYMRKIITSGRITILLGKQQAATGVRLSPRGLAERAGVSKDFIYRLDAGQARHIDLEALARVCDALHCELQDILIWETDHGQSL